MTQIQLELDSNCKGVTSETGLKFTADKHGHVEVPPYMAAQLKESGAARPAKRLFGGIDLPKPQAQ